MLDTAHRYARTSVLLASVADLLTTLMGLRAGFAEGNAAVAFILESSGVPGFILYKLSLALFAIYLSTFLNTKLKQILALLIPTMVWGGAAVLNAHLLL